MAKETKTKNKKLIGFLKFVIIYSCTAIAVMMIVWGILYAFLGNYEEGRPSVAMDRIMADFNSDNVDKILNSAGLTTNEFENKDMVSTFLKSQLEGREVSYRKSNGEYSETTPIYVIYADDTPLAKIKLTENGKNFFKFTKWKLGSISTCDISPKAPVKTVNITVPFGSSVFINNVNVSSQYIKQDNITFDLCKNIGEFVTPPTMTEYEITGLLCEPDIKVTYNNTPLPLLGENGVYICEYPEDASLLAAQKDNIINTAETYVKYILNRAPLSNL